jgi:hypothetical protein
MDLAAYPHSERLFPHPPEVRREALRQWYRQQYERTCDAWPGKILSVDSKVDPRRVEATVAAEDLPRAQRIDSLWHIWIDSVRGLRATHVPKRRLKWHAVLARFAWKIEGRTKGMQTYEHRVMLVKAMAEDDAVRRLQPEFKDYAHPYLNHDGQMVSVQFEEVLNVVDLVEEKIDPRGTEVYYRLYERRMKPEYEWHPLSETSGKRTRAATSSKATKP